MVLFLGVRMLRFEVLIINQSQSTSLKLIEYTFFLKERMLFKMFDNFREDFVIKTSRNVIKGPKNRCL